MGHRTGSGYVWDSAGTHGRRLSTPSGLGSEAMVLNGNVIGGATFRQGGAGWSGSASWDLQTGKMTKLSLLGGALVSINSSDWAQISTPRIA
jgi:hypothetical protein